ncbi:DUF3168 domain-containing protein [Aurantiacibacter aquimixticola]|uniref:DUF3168 domain-containing protein n=2 Tax=Aurantiacibacter aquimixticola TaxID=1958945 RepID=A0A419RX42_9SPHN|nr:DUF3168 domain-containing protein [Aurantiacibacter aquimixticola]RJY10347.1 DUF3168 domain-containing protein [Aurantiacibacter aquimixticola]
MENTLRMALIAWLASDPLLSAALNDVAEEAPSRAAPPWLGIAASASTDWSTKTRKGREVRVALELETRGEEAAQTAATAALIEDRIAALSPDQDGFAIANVTFLRTRAAQRSLNRRATLLEYRFRLLAA